MKYQPLKSKLYKLNRANFAEALQPNAIAIFHSNDMMPRTGDAFHKFRQNSDLLYLSGLDQEEVVVVLFPDCPNENWREVVFTKKTNEHIAVWEGEKYTKEEARKVSGIQSIYWLEDMDRILTEMIILSSVIYLNGNENYRFSSPVLYKDLRFLEDLKKSFPFHRIERSQPIMKRLRMVKSKHEIAAIQKAADLTEKAFRRVLKFTKPGVMEYEIEAEITHEFLRNAATGHAYEPIIASGANACVLHYLENNKACGYGDLLLMDFGAEYANYAADMTRTIPVNGKFTKRQKQVYKAVLKVMKASIEMLRPGTNINEYHKEVGKIMESQLIKIGLLDKTDVKNQSKDNPLYKQYFMHGTSHHLGLDVHDIGNFFVDIQPGMVFTCEPGIYIRQEGLGIRLEDDILVTNDKPINLMKNIPIEIEEIEEIMNYMELPF
jgi:Xaa-Pro aminopeptidase